jgi:hypothetical protein
MNIYNARYFSYTPFVELVYLTLNTRQTRERSMKIFHLVVSVVLVSLSTIAIAQYYEYDPDNPGELAPIREGEKAVIPLDTNDPSYNL